MASEWSIPGRSWQIRLPLWTLPPSTPALILLPPVLMPLNRLLVKLAMGLTETYDASVMEQVVDALVREVKSRHVRRLRDGLCSVEYGFVPEDILTACERAADHCSNVAVEMLQVAEGKLEAHEYLNALKAGELHESAAYAERFARYKAQYAFPEENANESGYPLPHRETGAADFCSGK